MDKEQVIPTLRTYEPELKEVGIVRRTAVLFQLVYDRGVVRHSKHRAVSLPLVILVSWLIALPEYCFQVPANRIGCGSLSAFQLKIIQEAITLTVFVLFALGSTWMSRSIDATSAPSPVF